ncbi:MAG: RNA polymerase sigma factor RpoD, partial [Caldilineaceae bacterium]|nr:RNA polymerase sigma factor RpoD [Caldilineaceae bacterium]
MARRRTTPNRSAETQTNRAPASSSESELDEYIKLGEEQEEEEDLFEDIADDEEEEDDSAPLPRIERDLELEAEIEQEKYVPVEKVIEDVAEVSQVLDPVRMYLR